MPKRIGVLVLTLSFLLSASIAQRKPEHDKPTEAVIRRYMRAIRTGVMLTPKGWDSAMELFASSRPFPGDGTIAVESSTDVIGQNSQEGEHARVSTKWGDFYGTVDTELRFHSAVPDSSIIPMAETFELVLTDKHSYLSAEGQVLREVSGPKRWVISSSPSGPAADPVRVIAYLRAKAATSKDPQIKKNAARTIRILNGLMRRSPACAC